MALVCQLVFAFVYRFCKHSETEEKERIEESQLENKIEVNRTLQINAKLSKRENFDLQQRVTPLDPSVVKVAKP